MFEVLFLCANLTCFRVDMIPDNQNVNMDVDHQLAVDQQSLNYVNIGVADPIVVAAMATGI